MIRLKLIVACLVMMMVAASAKAEMSWLPTWLGGQPKKTTSSSHHHKPARASTAHTGHKSATWFSGANNPFKGKPVTKTAAKKPTDKAAIKRTSGEKHKPSWFSSWFKREEPEPPRSISEWMELEQIKP